MENTIEFLYLRINAMQKKIEKLEMTISEINDYFLIDRNVDTKQLTKWKHNLTPTNNIIQRQELARPV